MKHGPFFYFMVFLLFIALGLSVISLCFLLMPQLRSSLDAVYGNAPLYPSISASPFTFTMVFLGASAGLLAVIYVILKRRSVESRMPTRELAEYYLINGKDEKAIRVYEALEMWEAVLDLRIKRREFALAIEACDRLGGAGLAKKTTLYEMMGDKRQAKAAAAQTGRYYFNRQEWGNAADMYFKAGEVELALQCIDKELDASRKSLTPAGWHEKVRRATATAEERKDFNRAGRYSELLLDKNKAIECYTQAGNSIRVAELLIEEERIEEAHDVLKIIGSDDPEHTRATALLGKVFFSQEMYVDATKHFVDYFKKTKVTEEEIEIVYMMAVSLERLGKLRQAREAFVRIHEMKPFFKNVDMRIDAIDRKGEETQSLSDLLTKDMEVKNNSIDEKLAPLRVGERYGDLEELGRGGAGVVYKATDGLLDRVVALKQLPEAVSEDPARLQAFFKEAKAIAKLNHPNIVSIYDILRVGNFYYLVMEYVNGVSVEKLVSHREPISLRLAVYIARHVLQALGFAHRNHVVHQDIKPANIMMTEEKVVKLMDFGIASMKDELPDHSVDVVMGTPKYISPEQLQGIPADERSDIYSFGITFYEMVTGALPYPEEGILRHHLVTPAIPPRVHVRDLPEELETILLRCLAKKREDRYQSVAVIIEDLKSLSRKIEARRGGIDDSLS